MSKKIKIKMPPPAPLLWKKANENQASYFIWNNVNNNSSNKYDTKSIQSVC